MASLSPSYTRTAIAFHWIVALLIVTNVALAWVWPNVADESVRPLINNHKTIGITLLGLITLRLLWRLTHPAPPFPAGLKRWETRLAGTVHVLLYIVMFALPLSGWIMDSAFEKAAENPNLWFGLFEWPRIAPVMAFDPATKKQVHDVFGAAHDISGKILYLLVALHIAGAIKHAVYDNDGENKRMGIA